MTNIPLPTNTEELVAWKLSIADTKQGYKVSQETTQWLRDAINSDIGPYISYSVGLIYIKVILAGVVVITGNRMLASGPDDDLHVEMFNLLETSPEYVKELVTNPWQ